MKRVKLCVVFSIFCAMMFTLCSCSSTSDEHENGYGYNTPHKPTPPANYSARIPQHITTSEKVVVIDPKSHVWGAYNSEGSLVKAGLATAGSNWCSDLGRPCHTSVGSFRIYSLGSPGCKSGKFPLPRGGAPMPYCMYFNKSQALHGSPSGEVIEGNISHGCVRVHVEDAEWIRHNFAQVGTKVIVRPYY